MAEPEQNLELLRRPVQNAVEKVKLYFPSNLCSAWFRTFRPVRNVTDPAKIIKDRCTSCRGTGYTSSRKKIKVSIPAGIDNGQSVRIREKGEPGVNGGPRGDLLVEVIVSSHPIFQRQDMNIFLLHRFLLLRQC